MISLIICSRKEEIPSELNINISNSIGIEYELIVIDNSQNKYSIFQAYNEGVKQAKYPYLCFMHEDILFHTQDWGQAVVEHFKDTKVGLIGVAGGHYLPKCPASWWSTECRSGQVLQGQYNNAQDYFTEKYEWLRNKTADCQSIEVVAVDGLWFCIPRKLFELIHFDELTFSGFHCYDTDICLQVIEKNYSANVIFDILIEHTSYGNQDERFVKQREILYSKWEQYFPLIKGIQLSENEVSDRCELVKELNNELNRRIAVYNELIQARSSYAYRLGRFILTPFTLLRKRI